MDKVSNKDPAHKKAPKIMLAWIITLGAVVRFIYLFQLRDDPFPGFVLKFDAFDQYRFVSLAKEFSGGNWAGTEVAKYSPGYSYIIAALYKVFGQGLNTVFIFQILLGIAAIYVLYRTGSMIFNNEKIGLIAAFIGALYSPLLFYECMALRASIMTYCGLFGIFFLIKAFKSDSLNYYLLSGLILGLTVALRPNILPFCMVPFIFAAGKHGYGRKAICALIFIVGLTAVCTPISLRNRALGSDVLISSQGPHVFWIGNTHDSSGIGYPVSVLNNPEVRETKDSFSGTLKRFFLEVKKHPKDYRVLYARKARMFLNGYEIPANLNFYLFRQTHNILKICFFDFTIICPLALLGVFLNMKRRSGSALLLIPLFVLSFSVIAYHIQGRYRMPSVPFFILFAAYFIYWAWDTARKKKYGHVFCAALVLIPVTLYTRPAEDIIESHFATRIRAIDYRNLAGAYLTAIQEEDFPGSKVTMFREKAADNLKKALKIARLDSRKYIWKIELGKVYISLGRYDDAKEIFYGMIETDPGNEVLIHYTDILEETEAGRG